MTILLSLIQGSSIDRGQRPFDSPRRPQRIREKGFGNSRSRRSQNLRRIPGWHSDHPQNRRRRDDPIGGYDKADHLCSYGHEQSAWALQVYYAIGWCEWAYRLSSYGHEQAAWSRQVLRYPMIWPNSSFRHEKAVWKLQIVNRKNQGGRFDFTSFGNDIGPVPDLYANLFWVFDYRYGRLLAIEFPSSKVIRFIGRRIEFWEV